MALTKLTADVVNIQKLPDAPTQTATELKQLMDKAGVDIKAYINNTLTLEQDQLNVFIESLTSAQWGYLANITSDIQTQLDGKQDAVAGVTSTEIGYLAGVTSAIQTQLNALQGRIDHGTTLPAAGQAGRVFILHK